MAAKLGGREGERSQCGGNALPFWAGEADGVDAVDVGAVVGTAVVLAAVVAVGGGDAGFLTGGAGQLLNLFTVRLRLAADGGCGRGKRAPAPAAAAAAPPPPPPEGTDPGC